MASEIELKNEAVKIIRKEAEFYLVMPCTNKEELKVVGFNTTVKIRQRFDQIGIEEELVPLGIYKMVQSLYLASIDGFDGDVSKTLAFIAKNLEETN